MTKEQVIKGAYALIKREADKRNLEIMDRGTGHGFEDTFWEDKIHDNSEIPNIIAGQKEDGYSIELRSFWGSPEIDIRIDYPNGQQLLIFNFSDSIKRGEHYKDTGDFQICQIRVDGCNNVPCTYKSAIEEVYEMIAYIEEKGKCIA